MFMRRHKAKERLYYYLYIYSEHEDQRVFSLGNADKALKTLAEWERHRLMPIELVALGMKKEHIDKWRKKIEDDAAEKGLQCFTYKRYNKNRKRPQRQLESFSS